jgi:type IV secretion system protein TrbL
MSSLRRPLARAGLVAALAALLLLGRPAPEQAHANVVCDAAGGAAGVIAGGVGIVAGAIGGGNPVGDACNAVAGGAVDAVTAPVTDALKGAGNAIFKQIAAWVSEGAVWLMGRVVKAIETSTSPHLDTAGFLRQYAKMAEIAVVLAVAMLLLAVLEGLAQGDIGMLARAAFVQLPLALIGASVAFLIAQLLLGATDGLCQAIASSTGGDGQRFFEEAIKSLGAAGGAAGEAIGGSGGADQASETIGGASGTVAVPLFVTFLAAAIGAFAAFFVWIELLMRDAAIYAVALFVPLSLAASIWPRWSGALRRTAELMVVVIASKFVIVAIISLAASLAGHGAGGVEQILAAAALMLLACFSPFVLLRLVPFAEGAMAAAYGRRSASGGAIGAVHMATQVQMMRSMAHAHWRGSAATGPSSAGGGGGGGFPGPASRGGPGGGGSPSGAGKLSGGGGAGSTAAGSTGGGATAAGAGAAAPAAALTAPVTAARGSKAAAERLGNTASAQVGGSAPTREASAGGSSSEKTPRPPADGAAKSDGPAAAPQPQPARGGEAPGGGERAPRPPAEPSVARQGGEKRDG